eukprot:jgi/Botrbrau1/8634/Bobra.0196s0028.1
MNDCKMIGDINIKTFSRKKERRKELRSVTAEHLQCSEKSTKHDAAEMGSSKHSCDIENINPNEAPALPEAKSEKTTHYSRRVAPPREDRHNAALQRHISIMKAHFEEVDQFELLTEIESPNDQESKIDRRSSPCGSNLDHDLENHSFDLTALQEVTILKESAPQDYHSVSQIPDPVPALSICEHTKGCIPHEEAPSVRDNTFQDDLDQETSAGLGSPQSSRDEYLLTPGPAKASAYGLGARRAVPDATLNASSGRGSRRRSCIYTDNVGLAMPHKQPSLLSRLSQRMSISISDALQRLGVVGRLSSTATSDAHSQLPVQWEAKTPDIKLHAVPQLPTITGSTPISHSPSQAQKGEDPCLRTEGSTSEVSVSPQRLKNDAPPKQPIANDGLLLLSHENRDDVTPHEEAVQQLDKLSVQDPSDKLEESPIQTVQDLKQTPSPLLQLLQLCNQTGNIEELPSMDELLGEHVDLKTILKIGEGTFGEAFRSGSVVFKIVPMEGELVVNGEQQKKAEDILAEVAIALTLSQLRVGLQDSSFEHGTSAFVETHGVGVCRGRYAADLVQEWEAWDRNYGSENDHPAAFPQSQLYIVFVVADGGIDLEHCDLRNIQEAKSILLQATLALAVAEEACEFEHRDLHWGNLLIQRVRPDTQILFRFRGNLIGVPCHGVQVTLIDFTLSRLKSITGDVLFCNLSTDPDLFTGPKRDCQAETYRRMKKFNGNEWHTFHPSTNCFWLHYLADTLVVRKVNAGTPDSSRHLRMFRKRVLMASSAADAAFDSYFQGSWLLQGVDSSYSQALLRSWG